MFEEFISTHYEKFTALAKALINIHSFNKLWYLFYFAFNNEKKKKQSEQITATN